MKIRFLEYLAGRTFAYYPDDVRDIPDDEALRLIARGYAEPAPDEPPTAPETAMVAPAPEKAMRPQPQPRKRAV